VRAVYREKVRVKHLAMEPSLQGGSVSFRFEKHFVRVALPKITEQIKAARLEFAEAEADVWDRDGNIINVHVYAVAITVGRLTFMLPTAAADHKSIDARQFDAPQTKRLDKRSDGLYLLTRRAVDYWLRVVRWKTGLGLIDVDARPENPSLFGGRLYNLAHGGAFYSPRIGRSVAVPRRHRLSPDAWREISKSLVQGERPPIWNEYAMSAQQRIEVGDLKASIVDLAIAAESVVRQFPKVPSKMRKKKRISELFRDWTQLGFPPVQHLSWFSDVKALVLVRNRIMHQGHDSRLTLQFCKSSASAVQQLIGLLT
jgi:hypothetical protein